MKVYINHKQISTWAKIEVDDTTYVIWLPYMEYRKSHNLVVCEISISEYGHGRSRWHLDAEGNVVEKGYTGPWLGWLVDIAIEHGLEIPER